MILWDMLAHTMYDQRVRIFVTNEYDQNIIVFNGGQVKDARKDENVFEHFADMVDHYEYRNGTLVILTKDENFEKKAESLYSEKYVKRWNIKDPTSRPWRTSFEIINGV